MAATDTNAERDHLEAQYLACVLLAPDAALGDDAAALASTDIRQETLRVAYEVACEHHAETGEVHLDLVTEETVRRTGGEWSVISPALLEVIQVHAVPSLAGHYAERITHFARLGRARLKLMRALGRLGEADADPDGILASVAEPGDEFGERLERYSFTSLSDLLARDTRQGFLINGALPENQNGLLFAPAKCLKTTIALDAAVSMAAAVRFLGWFSVPEAVPVGIVSGESGEANIRETLARQIKAKGLDAREFGHLLHLCFDLPQLNNADDLRHLRRLIVRHGWRALFLDPKYLLGLVPAEHHGNLSGAGDALRPLARLGRELGVSVCIVDHARKARMPNREFEPLDLFEVNGSGGSEFARWWWTLNLAERRDHEAAPGRHSLWFTTAGNAGFGSTLNVVINEGRYDDIGGRIYAVDVRKPSEFYAERDQARQEAKERRQAAGGERAAETSEKHRAAILDAMRGIGEPETKAVIKAKCRVGGNYFSRAWGELEADRAIEAHPIRKGRQSLTGWFPTGEFTPSEEGGNRPVCVHSGGQIADPGQSGQDTDEKCPVLPEPEAA